MPKRTLICLATCLSVALAGGAGAQQGDPKPGLFDLITPDAIAESLASVTLSALRTVMEVEYDHLSTDLMRGKMALSGVTLRPQFNHDRARQCEITVERASLDLGRMRPGMATANGSVTLIGAAANIACVPREAGMMLRASGYDRLEMDRVTLEVEYVHGTGEILSTASAAINNMITLDLATAGALLPRLDAFGTPGDPAIRLRKAVLGVQDTGGWARLSSQLPENLRQPEVIEQMGREELTNMLSDYGTRALTASERLFIEDLMAHVADFIRNPGELTIEAQLPANGLVLEPEIFDAPEELLQALAPDARTAPRAQSGLLNAALLGRIDGDLSPQERLTLARALIAGDGVPRSEALVPDLLAPLIDADLPEAGEAALVTAQAQAGIDPAASYDHALLASAYGVAGAVPLLDMLEERLTTAQVVAAQDTYLQSKDAMTGAAALEGLADIRAVRRQALGHFTGLGAARSYRLAYYHALMAEAAGDIGARSLRLDIEARFAGRGAEVDTLWSDLRRRVQSEALDDWIALDLAARFDRAEP